MNTTPKIKTINYLYKLQERDYKNKKIYILIRMQTEIDKMFNKNKCENIISKLNKIKKETLDLKVVELIENSIDYYDSILTILILTEEKKVQKNKSWVNNQAYATFPKISLWDEYIKAIEFRKDKEFDIIARNLDSKYSLRSNLSRSSKHNGKVW